MTADRVRISLTVYTDDQQTAARVAEQMALTAAGWALDGVETFIAAGPDADPEEDGE